MALSKSNEPWSKIHLCVIDKKFCFENKSLSNFSFINFNIISHMNRKSNYVNLPRIR